jgi:hypothetical protein
MPICVALVHTDMKQIESLKSNPSYVTKRKKGRISDPAYDNDISLS